MCQTMSFSPLPALVSALELHHLDVPPPLRGEGGVEVQVDGGGVGGLGADVDVHLEGKTKKMAKEHYTDTRVGSIKLKSAHCAAPCFRRISWARFCQCWSAKKN